MSVAENILKFVAARAHVPPDTLDYFFASGRIGFPSGTRLPFPAELIPLGARLVMRGWLNESFFDTNRDWILPYWAEQQFNPDSAAFIPHGFNLFTLNCTHRDWTLVGNPARAREALVDPRGLVTPLFDGWSLDVWIQVDGKLFAPSRLPTRSIAQSLHENMPVVVTTFAADGIKVRVETFAGASDAREFVATQVSIENPQPQPRRATLYLAIRPFNPEGVALVKSIEYREHAGAGSFIVNGAMGARVPTPDAVACARFREGDVALQVQPFRRNGSIPPLNGKTRVACDAGLATAVAAYHLDFSGAQIQKIGVFMPMERELIDEDEPITISFPDPAAARLQTIATWQTQFKRGMQIRVPDQKLEDAFNANKTFLLALHDGDSITPGPYTYHQFWFRDGAYLLNALDKLGFHEEARAVIEKFPKRLQKDGYLTATESEWDSNGAALWTMVEHARLSGDMNVLGRHYWSLVRMAAWINAKRQQTKDAGRRTMDAGQRSPHDGLLPPGASAEHVGPDNYFYWDDWWGLAGLRAAARAAEWLKQDADAEKLRANFESFRADVETSLAQVAARLGRAAMPASPYRRLDAACISALAPLYPLRLFDAHDARIVDTLAALKEVAWKDGVFFNHVGHSAFGTYLNLHIAECLLFQRNAAAWDILRWVLDHASPTWTWAEGIHPLTLGGCMGDGHHGWALADFLIAVRNLLLFEEDAHLVITPITPDGWFVENNVIKVENAPTYFGNVSYTLAFGAQNATLVLNGDWRAAPEYVEWNLPRVPREIGGDTAGYAWAGKRVRIPRGGRRVVAVW